MLYIYKWQRQADLITAWGVTADGFSQEIKLPLESFILLERAPDSRELPGMRCLEGVSYIDEYGDGKTYTNLMFLPTGADIDFETLTEIGNQPKRYNYRQSFLNQVDPLHRYFMLKHIPYYCGWFNVTHNTCVPIPEKKDIPSFTVLFYDIECVPMTQTRFPNELIGSDFVASISFVKCHILHDTHTILQSTVLLIAQRYDTFSTPDYTVLQFPSEKALLKHALTLFKDPTVTFLSGFNNNGFDDKYLAGRYFYHQLEKEIYRGVYPFKDGASISLWYHPKQLSLDVHKFYKLYYRYPQYSLSFLSKELLPDEECKKAMDYQVLRQQYLDINTCAFAQVKEMIEYNYVDSLATMKLFCKAKLLDFALTISAMCYLNAERVILAGKSELLTGYLLIEAYRNGYLINYQRKRVETVLKTSYQGAFVFLETPGIYKSISVLDFVSLYPSIVQSKNLSPSTLILCDRRPQTPEELDRYFWIEISEARFSWSLKKSVKVGVFPFLCQALLDARSKVKALLKETQSPDLIRYLSFLQLALKIINNSIYGLVGSKYSPFYFKPMAETITAHARQTILAARDYFARLGVTCVHIDTDSLFIMTQSEAKGRLLTVDVNRFIGDTHLTMEYESFYTTLFLYSKKKYFGLINDTYKSSGFELKKRDFPAHGKIILQDILELVLKEEPSAIVSRLQDFARALFRFDLVVRYDLFSKSIALRPMYKYSSSCSAPHVQFVKRLGERTPILQGQFVPLLYSPLVDHQKKGYGLGMIDPDMNRIMGHDYTTPVPVHLVQSVKGACHLFDKIFKIACQHADSQTQREIHTYFQDGLKSREKYNLVVFELNCMFNAVIVTFPKRFSFLTPGLKKRCRQTTITEYLSRVKKPKQADT